MNVNSATDKQTQPSSSTGLTGDTGDMFLKLLTTQLKAQDPLSPMDPNQFVGQLVQFNTLGEVMKIRELLGPSASQSSTSGNNNAGGH